MNTYQNLGQALRAYGAAGVGQITNPNIQPWSIPLDFAANIAAAGTGQAAANNENGWLFIALSFNLVVWNPAVSNNVIAGTPAYMRSDTGSAAAATNAGSVNTWINLSQFTLNVRTNTLQWFANPVRANLICGDAWNPGYRLIGQPIGPGQTIQATLNNLSAVAVQAQLLLDGYRIKTTQ